MKLVAGVVLVAGLVTAIAIAHEARADALSPAELERLFRGRVVHRDVDVELADGPYFGGVAYIVIHAEPKRVMDAIADPRSYRSILPLTIEAREVARSGDLTYVFLKQGARLGTASYTVVARRESQSLLRFWLDPSRPHEIADCWGSFRVQPLGKQRSLLTYAALVRLEAGLVRTLFKEKIRAFAMETPDLVRTYVEGHAPR